MSLNNLPYSFGVLDAPKITDAMVLSITDDDGPLAEDDVALPWDAATNYALAAEVSRATTHTVYSRLVAGTSATEPESDPTNWLAMRPTNKWAAFDLYGNTQTIGNGELAITLKPTGFVTAVWVGSVLAEEVELTVYDGDTLGAPVFGPSAVHMSGLGRYDWQTFFLAPQASMTSATWTGIPIVAAPVVVIKLRQLAGSPRVGTIQVGQFVGVGHTQYGADFGRLRYTDLSPRADGTFPPIVERPSGGDINFTALLTPQQAISLNGLLAKYDARPAVWFASERNTHTPLAKFGMIEGRVKYAYPDICEFSGNVTGLLEARPL